MAYSSGAGAGGGGGGGWGNDNAQPNGYFWKGADGQVWVQGDQGINSAGAWDPNTINYWTGLGFVQTPDSPASRNSASRNSASRNTTGGADAPPPLNQGAIDATQRNLDSLGGILAEALRNAQQGYDNANNQFNVQEQQQKGQYDESTLRNMGNYDANLAAALRAGRSGRAGLMAALRGGGGAGNDFARNWINDVVGDTTSNDIREGYNTFDENRASLDNSYGTFQSGLKEKRQKNDETLENNRRAARLYDAQQRQELLQKIAGFYGDAEMTGQRDNYLAQAGNQAPNIAANMNSYVKQYDTAPIEVQSPDVAAFAGPEKQAMKSTPNANTGIFSLMDPRRKERREELAGV